MRALSHRRWVLIVAAAMATALALMLPTLGGAQSAPPVVNPTIPAERSVEPVVLDGSDFPGWSAASNVTFKLPLTDLQYCTPKFDPNSGSQIPFSSGACDQHNGYAPPDFDSQQYAPQQGVPVDRLLGYRWNPATKAFNQIPFQVDEVFTRYLTNPASGFSIYSGDDQHTTYAYDREGFRYTGENGVNSSDPCTAQPTSPPMKDPVRGLDNNDELTFMASDAGQAAPVGRPLPAGIADARQVEVRDPSNPTAAPSYAYVMLATAVGPKPAFNASNGYVKYTRDPKSDWYAFSQSSYSDYGNAATGYYCDDNGKVVRDASGKPLIGRRRPRDWATVTTPRYQFHYSGRWLMDSLRISSADNGSYGPNVLDRWKARAFAQDPGSKTPCCGFEEEENNWGGSSILLGEKVGPVRAIRETWGADSGTNVVRRETFYRDEIRQKTWLRVHPIPPLDGIYSQWDFRANRMTKFYTPKSSIRYPNGINIDGRNDKAYGNLDDPCNTRYDAANNPNDTSPVDQQYRSFYRQVGFCKFPGFSTNFHASIDQPDLTISDANAALSWSITSGPFGSVVDRYQIDKFTDLTPGGAPQSLLAVPYYRDDSCFDDGTGGDPGPHLRPRSEDPFTPTRKCWSQADGDPNGNPRFYQGSIGTHGLHLLMVAESDNARQTVPVDEIVAEQRLVMLPHAVPSDTAYTVGEQYGRGFEKPLVGIVSPYSSGLQLPATAPLPCIPLPAVGTCTASAPGSSGGTGGAGGSNGSSGGSGGTGGAGGSSGGGANNGTAGSNGSAGSGGGDVVVQVSGETPASAGRPAGSGSAPTTPANNVRVKGLVSRTVRVRHGGFTVRCRTSGHNLAGCLVRAYWRNRLIASGFTRSRGGTVIVRLRMTRFGRRVLRSHRRGINARLLFVAMPTSGIGLAVPKTVRLRP